MWWQPQVIHQAHRDGQKKIHCINYCSIRNELEDKKDWSNQPRPVGGVGRGHGLCLRSSLPEQALGRHGPLQPPPMRCRLSALYVDPPLHRAGLALGLFSCAATSICCHALLSRPQPSLSRRFGMFPSRRCRLCSSRPHLEPPAAMARLHQLLLMDPALSCRQLLLQSSLLVSPRAASARFCYNPAKTNMAISGDFFLFTTHCQPVQNSGFTDRKQRPPISCCAGLLGPTARLIRYYTPVEG